MKIIKLLSILITLLILIWVGNIVYNKVRIVLKPQDLGVTYTIKNYESYLAKSKSEIAKMETSPDNIKSTKSFAFEGETELEESFSQEEISARISYSPWSHMPLKDTQIKIHKDGTVEVSGLVITSRLAGFIDEIRGGINISNLDEIIEYTKKLPVDMPVHILFKASVRENVPSINLTGLSIATQPIDVSKYGGNSALEALTSYIFMQVPTFYAKSVTFEEGKMLFEGRVPQKIYVK